MPFGKFTRLQNWRIVTDKPYGNPKVDNNKLLNTKLAKDRNVADVIAEWAFGRAAGLTE
jgi:hypothetical protein